MVGTTASAAPDLRIARRSWRSVALTGSVLVVLVGAFVLVGGAAPTGSASQMCRAPARAGSSQGGTAPASFSPSLLLAGGSLQSNGSQGLVASELATGRLLGQTNIGGPSQGLAVTVSPDGQRAYLLDATWLDDQQRAEWRLNELELPSLCVLRRTLYADGIPLLGQAQIVAVAHGGAEVYVETMRTIGPQRFDRQLGVGQPDSQYTIAVYDVARGSFTRTIDLDPPWCGVAQLNALPDGRLVVVCPVAHQVRLVDPKAGRQVGSLAIDGDMGAVGPDGHFLWLASGGGQLQQVDLTRLAIARRVDLAGGSVSCAPCVPIQRLNVSADGSRLFLRAAPGQPQLRATGRGTVVWVIDTASLQRVADVPLPEPAFDAAVTPDGRALLVSTIRTEPPANNQRTWLLDVPTGRELAQWPWAVCCLELWPLGSVPSTQAPAQALPQSEPTLGGPSIAVGAALRRGGVASLSHVADHGPAGASFDDDLAIFQRERELRHRPRRRAEDNLAVTVVGRLVARALEAAFGSESAVPTIGRAALRQIVG